MPKFLDDAMADKWAADRLNALQEQYRMTSAEFLIKYNNGELPDTPDFREWRILYIEPQPPKDKQPE